MLARIKKTDCNTSLPLARTEVLPQFVNVVDFMGYKTITKKDIPTQRCELTIEKGEGTKKITENLRNG
jgi:hypothetical protein